MKACPAREEALALLKKYNSEPFHIQHALTVEGVNIHPGSAKNKMKNAILLANQFIFEACLK